MLEKEYYFRNLPEEFTKNARYVSKLMSIIDKSKYKNYAERHWPYFKLNQKCYIYWPKFIFRNPKTKSYIANLVDYPKSYEPTRAYQRGLRNHVEGLLGPLCIPVDDDYLYYVNWQGYTPNSGEYAALVDRDNYTAFQYLKPNTFHAIRPQIFPPMDPAIIDFLSEVPEPIQLLYQAWYTLRLRSSENLFSFEDKGLGFTEKGFLFIHWERFLQTTSSIKWRHSPLSAQEVHDALRYYKAPMKLSNQMLLRNLDMPEGCILADAVTNERVRNRYLQALYEMGLGYSAESFREYCTIIDPAGLYNRKFLFDGRAYLRRRQRARKSFIASDLRQKQGLPPKRTEKLYSFEFTPARFLKEPRDVTEKLPDYQWFDDQHSETLYAIKKKGVFYFSRPNHLSTAQDAACVADVQVWLRTLDSLKMMMDVSESGQWDLEAKSIAIPRSDYLRTLTTALRQEAGKAFIVDFINRTDPVAPIGKPVTEYEFNKAMQAYMGQKHRDESTSEDSTVRSGNWYNKLVAKVAQEKVNPSLVRLEAYVKPPGYESPTRMQFYAPKAVSTFKRFAEASFGILEFQYRQTALCPLLTHNSHPAPYILAWARFCLKAAEQYYTAAADIERKIPRWSPEEDIILSTNYRTQGYLSDEQWSDLLAQLPLRTKAKCRTHMMMNNQLLKSFLTPQRLETHYFGNRPCTLTEAKRAVFLLGCARAELRRKNTINVRSSFVKKIFAASDEQIDKWPIPPSYDPHSFAHLLDPY